MNSLQMDEAPDFSQSYTSEQEYGGEETPTCPK